MPSMSAKVYYFAARAIFVPIIPDGATEGHGELVEQAFMDRMFAKRNLVRFIFLATAAALCLEAVLG